MLWTNLKIFGVVIGTLALYTYVANAIPQVQSEVPEELSFTGEVSADLLVAAGEDLYNGGGGCTACHGLGTRAPNLITDHDGEGAVGARCGSREPGKDCKTYLYEAMVTPAAFVVDGFGPIMPDMSRTLSNNQIWAMIAFLQDKGGTVTVTSADIGASGDGGSSESASAPAAAAAAGPATASTDALAIVQANGCVACHSLEGASPIGPSFAGIAAGKTADYLRNAILNPASEVAEGYEAMAGLMPATFGGQLTAAQLEAVVQWLQNQR